MRQELYDIESDKDYVKVNLRKFGEEYYPEDKTFKKELKSIKDNKIAGQIVLHILRILHDREEEYQTDLETAAYDWLKTTSGVLTNTIAISFFNRHLSFFKYPFDTHVVINHLYIFLQYEMKIGRINESPTNSKLYQEIKNFRGFMNVTVGFNIIDEYFIMRGSSALNLPYKPQARKKYNETKDETIPIPGLPKPIIVKSNMKKSRPNGKVVNFFGEPQNEPENERITRFEETQNESKKRAIPEFEDSKLIDYSELLQKSRFGARANFEEPEIKPKKDKNAFFGESRKANKNHEEENEQKKNKKAYFGETRDKPKKDKRAVYEEEYKEKKETKEKKIIKDKKEKPSYFEKLVNKSKKQGKLDEKNKKQKPILDEINFELAPLYESRNRNGKLSFKPAPLSGPDTPRSPRGGSMMSYSPIPGITVEVILHNSKTNSNISKRYELKVEKFRNKRQDVYFGASEECKVRVESLLVAEVQGQIALRKKKYYIKCLATTKLTLFKIPHDKKFKLKKNYYIFLNEQTQFIIEDMGVTQKEIPWLDIAEYYTARKDIFRERIFMHNEGEYIFGVSQAADYQIPKREGISNRHFRIGYSNSLSWYALDGSVDGASTNGTYISLKKYTDFKKKVPSKYFRLKEGMLFVIADAMMKVHIYIYIYYIYELYRLKRLCLRISLRLTLEINACNR